MPENNPKPFPQVNFGFGESNRFVNDIQRALNIAETGIYDFLTMCHVVVHKFRHGLNANDPSIDQTTWNSIVNKGQDAGTAAPEDTRPAAVAGAPAAAPAPRVTTAAPAAGPAAAPAPTAAPVDVARAAAEAAGNNEPVDAKDQAAAGGPTVGDPIPDRNA